MLSRGGFPRAFHQRGRCGVPKNPLLVLGVLRPELKHLVFCLFFVSALPRGLRPISAMLQSDQLLITRPRNGQKECRIFARLDVMFDGAIKGQQSSRR